MVNGVSPFLVHLHDPTLVYLFRPIGGKFEMV